MAENFSLLPESLEQLVRELSKLPGVGERTAFRYAVSLMKSGTRNTQALAKALLEIESELKFCNSCFFWSTESSCALCKDPRRNPQTLCIVRDCPDVLALEKMGRNPWSFHVLQGLLSPLSGIGPDELRFRELFERIHQNSCQEIILALDATVEGDATAFYLKDELKKDFPHLKITRLALGLPAGSAVEYLDASTLQQALTHRVEL